MTPNQTSEVRLKSLLSLIKDAAAKEDAREKWLERASIAEFDGGLSRVEAEQLATDELMELLKGVTHNGTN